jgi:hypothetical protein
VVVECNLVGAMNGHFAKGLKKFRKKLEDICLLSKDWLL